MNVIVLVWRCACDNEGYLGIISYLARVNTNKEGSTVPFIDNLEIIEVFKDKDEEEEASVMDLIN